MRTRQALSVAVATFAATAVPLAGPAWADPPRTITGSIEAEGLELLPTTERKGKTLHLDLADLSSVTGEVLFTPAGAPTFRTEYHCVVVDGKSTFHCRGEGSGTATVAGVGTGTVSSKVILTCTSLSPGVALCDGRLRIDGVGGDLAGVHATGTFANTGAPGKVTYELRLHRH